MNGLVVPEGVSEIQRKIAAVLAAGMPISEAARRLALPRTEVARIARMPRVRLAANAMREAARTQEKFTVDSAQCMYMEAYAMAVTSGEVVRVADSLVKLHGLAPRGPAVAVQINNGEVVDYSDLDDAELLEATGRDPADLTPDG
ncbi:MAG: hypothetical protein OXE50_14830 [Chloroflexi bacterium]|nr:hypothetical protein [Chloroflexota bacterium]